MASAELANELFMRRGLFGGAQEPVQRMDFNFGDAGIGGPFGNALAPMIMQPLINSFFGQTGIMPAQFAPQQSFYDQWRAKQYWQARQTAMTTASAADRETYAMMLRNMANMRGTPLGLDAQRSINVMAGDVAMMAPILAQAMPETFDQLHGTRGSATVMSSFLHRGGITAIDPATGRTGMTGASAGVLSAEIHRRFFGADADLASWRGISAGRAGAMYDELQTRGLMGSSVATLSREGQFAALTGTVGAREDIFRMLQAKDPEKFARISSRYGTSDSTSLAKLEGVAADALRDIQKDSPTQVDALLRQLDATKIGNRLKSMSGAVAAMREIFGDMGSPNAPMAQLIEGLNSLTQGGLSTMNPAQLEQAVRTTQVVARTSGMGIQALIGMTAQGAAMASKMGLDTRFGMTAAQGAAEFGAAYGQVGGGDTPMWGRLDRDKLTIMDQQLRLNAAASPMASRLGAIMRIVETQKAAGVSIEGTPIEAVAKAIQAGASEFSFGGKTETLNMNEGRWRQVVAASGISGSAAQDYLRSTAISQEQIDRYGIGDIVRKAQPAELRQMMNQHLHEAVVGQLSTGGITGERAANIARIASMAQSQAMADMTPETWANVGERNQALMDATRAAVMKQTGMGAAEFDALFPKAQFATMIGGGIGRIEQRFHDDPRYQGFGNLRGALDVNSQRVEAQRAVIRQENQAEVAMGKALSGLGTAGPLARLMNEIQKPSASFGAAIGKVLGGISTTDIRNRMRGDDLAADLTANERVGVIMEALMETQKQYDANKDDTTITAAERKIRGDELTAQTDAIMKGGGAANTALRNVLGNAGLIDPDTADDVEVKAVAVQVMQGKVGSPKLASVVGGLSTSAFTDPKIIRAAQEEVLRKEGITDPEKITEALSGKMDDKITEGGRKELRRLAASGRGLVGAMEAAGYHAAAKVGVKDLAGAVTQRELLAATLTSALPEEGPARDKEVARRLRYAGGAYERGRGFVDATLGDRDAVKNLGAGGYALVKSAREKYQLMSQIATNAGLNLAQIQAGIGLDKLDPAQRKAVNEITGLQTEVDDLNNQMLRRLNHTDPHVAMTPEELETYDKEIAADKALTDDAKNKKLLEKIPGLGATATDAEREELSKALGTGPEGEARRYALEMRAKAKTEFAKMAGTAGISVEELQKAALTKGGLKRLMGLEKISSADAARAEELMTTMGAMADDDTSKSVLTSIKDDDTRRAAAKEKSSKDAAGIMGNVKMSGEVTLKGLDKLDFSKARGEGMGSTPVPG